MTKSPPLSTYILFAGFFCLLLTLPACTVLGAGGPAATTTPLPTSSVPDLQVIPPQACLVTKQNMIRVDQPQGDLISWSPAHDTLAYVASTQGSSWNVGEMNLLSSPKFDTPVHVASGVAGELTWSPDGTAIAYLGLRRSDNLYTIGLALANGSTTQDLFPDEAARTDDYSSQKSILQWLEPTRLRLLVSCGLNCMQTLEVNTQSGLSSPVGDPIERHWDTWSAHTYHPAIIPPNLVALTGQLNWSPDEQYIAYIDGAANAWVIDAIGNSLYALDIGQYGAAAETDWSFDSQYLAVQVDQNLMIFKFKCP